MTTAPPQLVPRPTFPPLESGDRMRADQFRDALDELPAGTRAELLHGRAWVHRETPSARRVELTDVLGTWLRQYEVETAGVAMVRGCRARLGPRDEPWLDLALYVPGAGNCRQLPDGSLDGPPEFAVCLSETGRGLAFRDRADACRRGGVLEYLAVAAEPGTRELRWYRFDDDPLRPTRDTGENLLRSGYFTGLWLPESVVTGDPRTVDTHAPIRRGTGTLEHAAFVNRLCALKPR